MQTILEYLKHREKQNYTDPDVKIILAKNGVWFNVFDGIEHHEVRMSSLDKRSRYGELSNAMILRGWRLPTAKEMHEINDNLKDVNSILLPLGDPVLNTHYWCNDNGQPSRFEMGSGKCEPWDKLNDVLYVRYIYDSERDVK